MPDHVVRKMEAGGRNVELYLPAAAGVPLVVYHAVRGEGAEIRAACERAGCPPFALAAVDVADWNGDMTPWPAPSPFGGEFSGGADAYLEELTGTVLPAVLGALPRPPSGVFLAGYSLAGLFSLYAVCRKDGFSGAVSASGSFWYPGFADFVRTEGVRTGAVYLSLGDREHLTGNRTVSGVLAAASDIRDALLSRGTDAVLETNPGNHFAEQAGRTARGIKWILGRAH